MLTESDFLNLDLPLDTQCCDLSDDGASLVTGQSDGTALLLDFEKLLRSSLRIDSDKGDKTGDELVRDLESKDAVNALGAVMLLSDQPEDAITRIRAVAEPSDLSKPNEFDAWIGKLGSGDLQIRRRASEKLRRGGEAAYLAMRRQLNEKLAAEVRSRLELLVATHDRLGFSSARARIRSVHVLERFGSAASRELLKSWASGESSERIRSEASRTLRRLEEDNRDEERSDRS